LESVSSGEVFIGDAMVNGMAPKDRNVAVVFQSYALYPHMTVGENMGFSLRMAGVPLKERQERVAKAAAILQLDSLLHRLPKELSGGQRQRVAIGRAIVREPGVFLFDEPLSNLDAELRVQMRLELTKLHRQLGTTMVFVTHDQVEAMTLANRIVVLREGRIEQVGTPVELYEHPANRFVAGFIGSPKMNFLRGAVVAVTGSGVRVAIDGLASGTLDLAIPPGGAREGDTVTVGIRPEHLKVGAAGPSALSVDIEFSEQLGGASHLHAPNHPAGPVIVWHEGVGDFSGQRLNVAFDPARAHLFTESGAAIPRVARAQLR